MSNKCARCIVSSGRPFTYVVSPTGSGDRFTRSPSASNRPKTSTPRPYKMFARDVVVGPGASSTTRTETPCSNRPQTSVSPVGPAPTTTTAGEFTLTPIG
jgi:hypothetical protein